MKLYFLLVFFAFGIFCSSGSLANEPDSLMIISCTLPGRELKEVSFFLDNNQKEIIYNFKRNGKSELNVIFNERSKLKRLIDKGMGAIYYGFVRGSYSYVINIINGDEGEGYNISFFIKKGSRIIQSNDCLSGYYRGNFINDKFILDVPIDNNRDEVRFP